MMKKTKLWSRHTLTTPARALPPHAQAQPTVISPEYRLHLPLFLDSVFKFLIHSRLPLYLSTLFPFISLLCFTLYITPFHFAPLFSNVPTATQRSQMKPEVEVEVEAEARTRSSQQVHPSMPTDSAVDGGDMSISDSVFKRGNCLLSELKAKEMLRWGKRHKVKFIGRHNSSDHKNLLQTSSNNAVVVVHGDGEKKPDLCENGKAKEEEEEEEEEEENEEEEKDDELDETFVRKLRPQRQGKNHRKRKRNSEGGFNRIRKPLPPPKENQKVVKIAINRWSAERFKLAEQNMLNVMKAKGAVFGNPIVRLELRQEARKLIGDTGLLDHLLKHMAGKVAPGGVDRFRRRHNPEGVMEYWLESADLVRIRREAGVQDPYWTPPLGWKPGDNPSQDPIFAKEMKGIKEEMAQMKRDMEELKSKSRQEGSQAIVNAATLSCSDDTNHKVELHSSWIATKEIMFMELVKKNDELGEQVMKMSHSLKQMEKELGKLKKSTVKKEDNSGSIAAAFALRPTAPTLPATAGTKRDDRNGNQHQEIQKISKKGKNVLVIPLPTTAKQNKQKVEATSIQTATKAEPPAAAAAVAANTEEKAAAMDMDVVVVQSSSSSSSRQKSGFKICKPQGTFLWPDDIAAASSSQQVVVPTTLFHKPDLVVPSPPPPPPHVIFSSTNTTTLASLPLLFPAPPPRRPTSPVKPLAQRRAINVTVSTQRRPIIELAPSESDHGSNCSSITGNTPTTTTTTTTTRRSHNHSHGGGGGSRLGLIDLNSVPTTTNNNEPGFCGTPTSSSSTYHPPPHFHSLSITNSVSRLREKEMNQQALMVGMEAETKVLMDYYLQQKKKKMRTSL